MNAAAMTAFIILVRHFYKLRVSMHFRAYKDQALNSISR